MFKILIASAGGTCCVPICPEEKSLGRKLLSRDSKNLEMARIFGKVLSPSDLLILGGPAGGEAPGKVIRIDYGNGIWLVETEGTTL